MRDLPYCPAPPAAPLLQPAAPDVNPIGSALASGLWISSQAVYNSRRPVSSLLRALWRSLAYILSTTYSLVSYILSPFLTVLTTLLLSPARTLLDLADAVSPWFSDLF